MLVCWKNIFPKNFNIMNIQYICAQISLIFCNLLNFSDVYNSRKQEFWKLNLKQRVLWQGKLIPAKFFWNCLKIVNEKIRRGCWIPLPGHTHQISHGQLSPEVVEASQRTETSRWNKPHVLFSVEPVGSNENCAQFSIRFIILLLSMHLNRLSRTILHRN